MGGSLGNKVPPSEIENWTGNHHPSLEQENKNEYKYIFNCGAYTIFYSTTISVMVQPMHFRYVLGAIF